MKLKGILLGLFMALLVLPTSIAWAQQSTIEGRVVGATSGDPLPGASVVLEGTQIGTATDIDGEYELEVDPGTYRVVASYVGFESQTNEVTVGAGETVEADFALEPGALELEGVAVTALGFTTSRDRQGSSSQSVRGTEIAESGETSVLKGLSGKAAGVNITSSSGDPGSGARIQIRGQSTIQGDNEPLIVVDGVPVSNATQGEGVAGVTQQSRLNDLNPEDIASVEVLKGASAAALWGSRAQNGVIVIKTKGGQAIGQRRTNVSYKTTVSSTGANKQVPLQQEFGQGFRGTYLFGNALSWGDRIATRSGEPIEYVTGEDAPVAIGLQTGREYREVVSGSLGDPHGGMHSRETFDHFDNFFESDVSIDNNLSISGGDDNGRYYLSLANTRQNGIIPTNSNYQRTSIRLNAERHLSDKLTVGGIANYVRVNSDRIQMGSNLSGIMLGLLRTPPDFFMRDYLVDFYPNGLNGPVQERRHRSYRNPLGAGSRPGYDNPYFTINRNTNGSLVNRIMGKVSAEYDILDWLNLIGRVGLDTYTDRRAVFFAPFSGESPQGQIAESNRHFYSLNSDLILRGKRFVNPDIVAGVTLGINASHRESDYLAGDAQSFLNPVDLRSLQNAVSEDISANTSQSVRRTLGVFGELDLELYDQLFLKGTGRFDRASTFGPEADNTFFYPSITAAWQFSEILPINNIFSFGKLRASYAEVGREPGPFLAFTDFVNAAFFDGYTGTTLNALGYGGGFQRSGRLPAPTITPERKTEFEVGTDLRFLGDRVQLGATYYRNRSKDLIFNVDVAPSTGFTSRTFNAAEIENNGLELTADVGWINTNTFGWNTYVNWWTNENTVTDLEGVTEYGLAGFTSMTSSLVEGEPFGVLFGDRFRRESFAPLTPAEKDDGYAVASDGRVLNPLGFPVAASTQGIVGDPNPDWRAGIGNAFRFKGVTLDVLFDIKSGGDVWNGTKGALFYFGKHAEQDWYTTLTAEQANTVQNYFGCTVVQMHNADCAVSWYYNGTVEKNDDGTYNVRGRVEDFGAGEVLVDEAYFWSGPGSGFTGGGESFIEDGSYVRLRELTLAYNWNTSLVRRIGLSSVDVSLTGRNLWLSTDYTGVDPETNLTGPSNGQGLDYFNNPNTRSYQVSVRFNY